MKKRFTLKPSLKSAALMLGAFAFPLIANAEEPWKWESEAENASEMVYCQVSQATADGNEVSNGAFVSEMSVGKDSRLGWVVTDVPAPGMYDLTISYISMQERFLLVKIADRDPIVVDCRETSGGWDGTPSTEEGEDGSVINHPGVVQKTITVYIPYAGDNDLVIKAFDGISETEGKSMSFAPNLDKVTIVPSSAALVEAPEEMESIEIEAETCPNLSGTAKLMDGNTQTYSGNAGITLASAGRAIFTISVPETGAYALYINYTTMQKRWIYVKANAQPKQYVEFAETTTSWGDAESDDPSRPTIYKKAVLLYLEAGENTIMLNSYNGPTSEHSDSPNMDKIELVKVQADLEDPGYETIAYAFDYTDMAGTTITSEQTDQLTALYDNDERTSVKLNVKEATFMAKLPYPLMLTGYGIASPNNMENWKIEGSSDGQAWNEIGSVGVSIDGVYQKHNVLFDREDATAYQYFRLVAKGEENLEVAEWQLFGSPFISAERPLPADLFKGDATELTASENGWNAAEEGGEKYQNVLDGKLTTKFTADGDTKKPTVNNPLWLQYQFDLEYPDGIQALSYSLTMPWELSDRDPKNWALYGYSVESGDWETLDVRENQAFPTVSSTMVFNISKPMMCFGYRLEITSNNGSNDNTHLTAWQLFAEEQVNSVAIHEVHADDVISQVYAVGNKIMIKADKRTVYSIYGLSGQKVREGVVDTSAEEVVPAGFYIVTVNGVATKVMTR